MAIILKNSVFLHFPKTGGMWTEKVLREIFKDAICLRGIKTIGHETINDLISFQEQDFIPEVVNLFDSNGNSDEHDILAQRLKSIDFSNTKYFSIVREPIEYWKSFWRYRMSTQWWDDHWIDKVSRSDNFVEFVDKLLDHLPGECSRLYNEIIPIDRMESFTIGRFENLQSDVLKILHELEGDFDEQIVLNTPPFNTTSKVDFRTDLDRERTKRLYQSELEAYQRFGYELSEI